MGDNFYYSKGFQREISDTHSWRNVENSLHFMLEYIRESSSILDVGCGPGTITVDLASRVPNGKVIGIDTFEDLVLQGQLKALELNLKNITFEVASATSLPYENDSFDIVIAHQVLLHLADPKAAFEEMRRVVKPGGVVCCKDAELDSLFVSPLILEAPIRYYFLEKATGEHTSIKGGRDNKAIALACGFNDENTKVSCSTWCFSSTHERAWFSNMHKQRLSKIEQYDKDNFTKDEIFKAWNRWANESGAVLVLCHLELICTK